VIAAVILIYAAVEYLPDSGSLADELETQKSLLLRQRELIGHEDFYKKRIEDAEKDLAGIKPRLLPGNNAVVVGMELQRILNDFAEQSGVVISQRNTLPEKRVTDSDSLIKVSVSININNCLLEDLVEFLTTIENYDKFLKVEEINIAPATVATAANPTNPAQRQNQNVNMNMVRPAMTVVGYISAPQPEPAAKPGDPAAQTAASAARAAVNR